LLPLKIQGDSYSFDIAESEYVSQIALTHSNGKVKELNSKNCVFNYEVIY